MSGREAASKVTQGQPFVTLFVEGGPVKTSSGLEVMTSALAGCDRRTIDTLVVGGGPGVHRAAAEPALVDRFRLAGFTFISGKSRRGKFQLKRKSRPDRMRAKLQAIKQELRRRMHQPIPRQGQWLRQVVTGYFNYHAVPTNGRALVTFRFHIIDLWTRTLRRRSQKDRTTWERIRRLADDLIPKPRILHPWPEKRFAVKHPRRGQDRLR